MSSERPDNYLPDGWVRVEPLTGHTYTYQPPVGTVVGRHRWKAGLVYGDGWGVTVAIVSSGPELSHADFELLPVLVGVGRADPPDSSAEDLPGIAAGSVLEATPVQGAIELLGLGETPELEELLELLGETPELGELPELLGETPELGELIPVRLTIRARGIDPLAYAAAGPATIPGPAAAAIAGALAWLIL